MYEHIAFALYKRYMYTFNQLRKYHHLQCQRKDQKSMFLFFIVHNLMKVSSRVISNYCASEPLGTIVCLKSVFDSTAYHALYVVFLEALSVDHVLV